LYQAIKANKLLLCLFSRHIFAIGNAAYYQMLKDEVNQVVVIRYTHSDHETYKDDL
jgi:hypothetical protein